MKICHKTAEFLTQFALNIFAKYCSRAKNTESVDARSRHFRLRIPVIYSDPFDRFLKVPLITERRVFVRFIGANCKLQNRGAIRYGSGTFGIYRICARDKWISVAKPGTVNFFAPTGFFPRDTVSQIFRGSTLQFAITDSSFRVKDFVSFLAMQLPPH